MKHFGDITKLSGFDLPPVDVITGGSPCQDLSVAGKRAGLDGERSGLFMDQIRIVKEMRRADVLRGRSGQFIRPRYMVWENVPGAFSSGKPEKGADFAAVIEEIIKVCEPDASVSVCVPDGGWTKSGCYYAEDGSWSIAWRVHDAQFWGVPQRRKRIALVADFGGLSAPEILFERKGLSRDPEPSGTAREETAGATGGGVEGAEPILLESNQNHATVQTDGVSTALPASMGMGGGYVPMVVETDGGVEGAEHGHQPVVALGQNQVGNETTYCIQGNCIDRADTAGCNGKGWTEDVSYTLNTIDRPAVMAFKQGQGSKAGGIGAQEECSPTLSAVASGTNQVPAVMAFAQNQVGEVRVSPMSGTLNTNSNATGRNSPLVYDARGNGDGEIVLFEPRSQDGVPRIHGNVSPTLNTAQGGQRQPCVVTFQDVTGDGDVLPFDTTQITSPQNGNNPHYGDPCHPLAAGAHAPAIVSTYQDVTGALTPGAHPGSYNGQDAYNDMLIARNSANAIVRRLTPLECERLQGYPDGWTDIGEWVDSKGKKHKEADSPRYKALGNSIALPFWQFLARRICAQYERDITMASLFDGIGGFPLVFERCGAKAVWASEIEEFPIAVTKRHFPEVEDVQI